MSSYVFKNIFITSVLHNWNQTRQCRVFVYDQSKPPRFFFHSGKRNGLIGMIWKLLALSKIWFVAREGGSFRNTNCIFHFCKSQRTVWNWQYFLIIMVVNNVVLDGSPEINKLNCVFYNVQLYVEFISHGYPRCSSW